MQAKFQLVPIGFYQDEIQIIYQNDQLILNDQPNWPIDNLNPRQIKFQKPVLNNDHLIIPTLIELNSSQFETVLHQNPTYQNTNWDLIDHFNNQNQTVLKQIHQTIIQQIKSDRLRPIYDLLPSRFNMYYLTKFLNQLTHLNYKPNNLARVFKTDLIFIEKDRSHVGYPKNVFKVRVPNNE